jgi:hypothetical protein
MLDCYAILYPKQPGLPGRLAAAFGPSVVQAWVSAKRTTGATEERLKSVGCVAVAGEWQAKSTARTCETCCFAPWQKCEYHAGKHPLGAGCEWWKDNESQREG